MAGLVSDPEMLQFSISLIFLFFNVFESEGQEKEAIISTQQLLEASWMERQKTVLEIQIPICWQLRLAEWKWEAVFILPFFLSPPCSSLIGVVTLRWFKNCWQINWFYLKSTGWNVGLWESVFWNSKDLTTCTWLAEMKVQENNILFSETKYACFLYWNKTWEVTARYNKVQRWDSDMRKKKVL